MVGFWGFLDALVLCGVGIIYLFPVLFVWGVVGCGYGQFLTAGWFLVFGRVWCVCCLRGVGC